MANALKTLFADIAEAIRSKTGDTGTMMKPAEFPSKIGAIEVGGGSSADVRYVTFMNGAVELYRKPVAVGDDCVNVLTKGLISTPTKESVVSEVYSYSGWSLTDGGDADESALLAVEENRTVYAAYTASAREYTINFYDGETLLESQKVAYGSTPSYTPTKDGYDFVAWTPELAPVTGDASYSATWKEQATFASASWAQIKEIVDNGTVSDYFALGDRRTETITYSDGTTEDVTFELVDMTANKVCDDSTITLIATHALATPRVFHGSNSTSIYYSYSDLVNYLGNELLPCFSEDFRNSVTAKGLKYAGMKSSVLHIPTVHCVHGKSWEATGLANSTNSQADLFKQGGSAIRATKDGTNVQYWCADTRTYNSKYYALYTDENGNPQYASAPNVEKYIVLMVCI